MKYGYKLVTDGTDNHLVLWDMRKEVKPTYVSSSSNRADVCNHDGLCTLYRGRHDVSIACTNLHLSSLLPVQLSLCCLSETLLIKQSVRELCLVRHTLAMLIMKSI